MGDRKKVRSRVFSGRYATEKGAKPVSVCLNTPDREIARNRLRAIVLEEQREHEGIIAPKAVRVVHFHAFRKTWQTLGVRYGINQRAAQEVLGHSDPSLTARAYTDVAALALHSEIAKLPWISGSPKSTQTGIPKPGNPGPPASFRVIAGTAGKLPQFAIIGAFSPFLTLSVTSGHRPEMVDATGLEPVSRLLQACLTAAASVSAETDDTQQRTQNLAHLREVIAAWPKLSADLRAAVRAVTRTATR